MKNLMRRRNRMPHRQQHHRTESSAWPDQGIGPQIATVLATEVFYREFKSRRSPSWTMGALLAATIIINRAVNTRASYGDGVR